MIEITNPQFIDVKFQTSANTTTTITWTDTYDPPGTIYNIYISVDGGANWINIATSTAGYSYQYTMTASEAEDYIGHTADPTVYYNDNFRIKIEDATTPAHFAIANCKIRYIAVRITIPSVSDIVPEGSDKDTYGYADLFNIRWDRIYEDEYTVYNVEYNLNPTGDVGWTPFNAERGYLDSAPGTTLTHLKEYAFRLIDDPDYTPLTSTWSARFRLIAPDDNNYYDVTRYITFHQENIHPTSPIFVTSDPDGLNTGNTPPVRYETGMRVSGEKAIWLDEFLTLGQIEFGYGMRGRVRSKTGQLPDYETGALDGVDRLLKSRNVVIEIDPNEIPTQRPPRVKVGYVILTVRSQYDTEYGQIWYGDIAHNWQLEDAKLYNFILQLNQVRDNYGDPYNHLESFQPLYNDVVPWYNVLDANTIRVWGVKKGTTFPGLSELEKDKINFVDPMIPNYKFWYRLEEIIIP